VQNAQFNGVNLIDGSTKQITALASTDGTHRITVSAENMSLSGKIVTIASTGSISTQSKASTMMATVETSLTNVDSALAQLSSGASKFSIQSTFVQQLSDRSDDRHRQSGRRRHGDRKRQLNSLQTKQQLGVQALSIANSAPSIALKLFG
jgi:flagellin